MVKNGTVLAVGAGALGLLALLSRGRAGEAGSGGGVGTGSGGGGGGGSLVGADGAEFFEPSLPAGEGTDPTPQDASGSTTVGGSGPREGPPIGQDDGPGFFDQFKGGFTDPFNLGATAAFLGGAAALEGSRAAVRRFRSRRQARTTPPQARSQPARTRRPTPKAQPSGRAASPARGPARASGAARALRFAGGATIGGGAGLAINEALDRAGAFDQVREAGRRTSEAAGPRGTKILKSTVAPLSLIGSQVEAIREGGGFREKAATAVSGTFQADAVNAARRFGGRVRDAITGGTDEPKRRLAPVRRVTAAQRQRQQEQVQADVSRFNAARERQQFQRRREETRRFIELEKRRQRRQDRQQEQVQADVQRFTAAAARTRGRNQRTASGSQVADAAELARNRALREARFRASLERVGGTQAFR